MARASWPGSEFAGAHFDYARAARKLDRWDFIAAFLIWATRTAERRKVTGGMQVVATESGFEYGWPGLMQPIKDSRELYERARRTPLSFYTRQADDLRADLLAEESGMKANARRKSNVSPIEALSLAKVNEGGVDWQTGERVVFAFTHNTQKSPGAGPGDRYQQKIEPAGYYATARDESDTAAAPPSGWVWGTAQVTPLVLVENTRRDEEGVYGPHSRKARLSAHYGGKKRKSLSQAVLRDGYDAIVTVGKYGTGEIVLLDPQRSIIGTDEPMRQNASSAASARSPSGSSWTTRAPFHVGGQWRWVTWTHRHANKHAAIIEKADELGADGWDFGQADHDLTRESRYARNASERGERMRRNGSRWSPGDPPFRVMGESNVPTGPESVPWVESSHWSEADAEQARDALKREEGRAFSFWVEQRPGERMSANPSWGEGYGYPFVTPRGRRLQMFRKGQKVRFYDERGRQVGPEQSNVGPAVAYAMEQGWRDEGAKAQARRPSRYQCARCGEYTDESKLSSEGECSACAIGQGLLGERSQPQMSKNAARMRPAVRRLVAAVADQRNFGRVSHQTIEDAIQGGYVVELREGVPGYEYGVYPYRATDKGLGALGRATSKATGRMDPGILRRQREEIEHDRRVRLRPNKTGQGKYWVWLVQKGTNQPLRSEGPYGPHDLEGGKTFARIGATEGQHDRAVSLGRDPGCPSFQIVRRYRAGTGERVI